MTIYTLQEAQEIKFSFRFFITDSDGVESEFTDDISSLSIWHGEIAERVYGWALSLSGKNYSSYFTSGNSVRVLRGEIDYDGEIMEVNETWYLGTILTVSTNYTWGSEDWEMKVVDPLTYLSSRVCPIISTSQATVGRYATATADSYTTTANIIGQNEVTGNPVLTPDRVIDNNMSTLWVSSKSPVVEPPDSWYGHFWNAHLSEIFAWPIPSLDKQSHTWLEFCLLNFIDGNGQPSPKVSSSNLRLMSRSGILEFHSGPVEFGELYGPVVSSTKTRFATLCFDAGIFSSVWGTSPNHCPIHEWKNLSAAWTRRSDYGRVSGRNWGFNSDGNGDYLAVSWGVHPDDLGLVGGSSNMPWGRNDPKWVTMFVEDGASVSGDRIDQNATFGVYVSGTVVELHVSSQVAANHFAGCFFRAYPINPWNPGTHWFNSVRYIVSHTASGATPPYVIRVTTDPCAWDSYNFPPGTQTPITPWPAASWTEDWSDSTGLTGVTNSSFKLKNYGKFNGLIRWEEDKFPSVGYSGSFQNHELLSWVMLSIDDMTFVTTSPIIFGDTVIEVAATDGLTPTGYIYIDLDGPFEYLSKTSTSITLASSYSGSGASIGATITQCESDGSSILEWPVDYISIRRKAINSSTPGQLRVIKTIRVYATSMPSPRTPGDDVQWWEDWTQISSSTNNTSAITLDWQLENIVRYSSYIFVIQSMSDESQGRANEIVLGMPHSVLSVVLENATVVSFFEYILIDLMGFTSSSVDTSGCVPSFLGEFTTDTTAYLALLSDMCRRTGTVINVAPAGTINVTANLGWVNQPDIDQETNLSSANTTAIRIEKIDNRSISQVQVMAQDYYGNILLGKYPPTPRFFGEPYRELDLYSIGSVDPNQIARYIFSQKTAPVVSSVTVGPALWVNPGIQAISIYEGEYSLQTGNDFVGNWLVSSAEHAISFGSKTIPATWTTSINLMRMK